MNLASMLNRFTFDEARMNKQQAMLKEKPYTDDASVLKEPVDALSQKDFQRLPERTEPRWEQLEEKGKEALKAGRVAVVLLNGGMATRFGGKAKGVTEALGKRSFLDLRLSQIAAMAKTLGAPVPVVLMNSFATQDATVEHLKEHKFFGIDEKEIFYAPQGISLRLTEHGEIFKDKNNSASAYAPGHGDLPFALEHSGVAEKLRRRGVRHVFVSNIDNLGATLEPALVGAHLSGRMPMTVELCERLPTDVGGAPARVGGQVQIVEGFRMPKSFPAERLIGFNTNTFYFDWPVLDPRLDLPFYPVAKLVDDKRAIQFERILGELSRHIPCQLLLVPRDAEQGLIYPVKNPEDLAAKKPALAQRFA